MRSERYSRHFFGASPAAQILTAELNGIGITNALNAISVTIKEPIKSAVESAVTYFDVLEEIEIIMSTASKLLACLRVPVLGMRL